MNWMENNMVDISIVLATRQAYAPKNSPVLSLRAPLRGTADKVTMTMVALIGHPVRSARSSPNTTVSTHCQFCKDSPASYPTPQQPEMHEFYSPAVLRDIPTDVPTTAAAPAADNEDDDDRRRCHTSISVDNITTIDPIFLQERDAFYKELLHFANSLGASSSSTNEAQNDSATAASTAANNDSPAIDDHDSFHTFLSELDALHQELILLLPKPSASPHVPLLTTIAILTIVILHDLIS